MEERLNNHSPSITKFEEIQVEIESLSSDQNHIVYRNEFETVYFDTIAEAKKLIANKRANLTSLKQVRLPRIDIPNFDGAYEHYPSFYDTFNSIIHGNMEISDVQKLHYLKSCLQGDALELVRSLKITAQNYDVAWDVLQKRYDNKRLIVKNHVRAIREIPQATKESHSSLR